MLLPSLSAVWYFLWSVGGEGEHFSKFSGLIFTFSEAPTCCWRFWGLEFVLSSGGFSGNYSTWAPTSLIDLWWFCWTVFTSKYLALGFSSELLCPKYRSAFYSTNPSLSISLSSSDVFDESECLELTQAFISSVNCEAEEVLTSSFLSFCIFFRAFLAFSNFSMAEAILWSMFSPKF